MIKEIIYLKAKSYAYKTDKGILNEKTNKMKQEFKKLKDVEKLYKRTN